MTSVSDLVNAYSQSCVEPLKKTLGKKLTTVNKDIKNFQAFLVKKQYRKIDPEADDRGRYNAMMVAICNALRTNDELTSMLSDVDGFFTTLSTLFCSDDVHDLFSGDFSKGSFKALATKLNRFFNPKKEEDSLDAVEDLESYIKPYAPNFGGLVSSSTDLHFYSTGSNGEEVKDDDSSQEAKALTLMKKGVGLMSLVSASDESSLALWVTDCESDAFDTTLTHEQFMVELTSQTFDLNPVHFVGLDTVKRDFMAKNYDLFRSHCTVLAQKCDLNFHSATYKFANDFNEVTEDRITNSVNGFPQKFVDLSRNAFCVFNFDGDVGDVKVNAYWLFTKKVGEVVPRDDYDSFEWSDLTLDEFVEKMQSAGTIGTSYLH